MHRYSSTRLVHILIKLSTNYLFKPALVATLKKIINEAWKNETLDTAKLAKYMRCLFQIAISENTELAEQLLDQVQSHAEEALEVYFTFPPRTFFC